MTTIFDDLAKNKKKIYIHILKSRVVRFFPINVAI